MATLDIFNNDAFSLSSLSQTITDIPRIPTQLGDEGLFAEYGMNTTTMMIERQGSSIKLLPTAPRGGVPEPVSRTGRKLVPLAAVHIPVSGSVMADEVQGIRAFGSETEVESVMNLVRRVTTNMKQSMDLTIEHLRVGALKGTVLDADGSTVLWDLYDIFGFTQQTVFFDLGNSSADIKAKVISLKRLTQIQLGGRPTGKIKVQVSQSFFDQLTSHSAVKAAWNLWNNGQYLRDDQSEQVDFELWGVQFKIYAGGTSAGDFIPAGEGYSYPTGVPSMFQIAYAPAPFMETVNTNGLPYYLKQERMKYDLGVELFGNSNPLAFNSLPEAVLKVSAAAA